MSQDNRKAYTHKANQYLVAPAEAVAAALVVVDVVVLAVVEDLEVLETFDVAEAVVLGIRH